MFLLQQCSSNLADAFFFGSVFLLFVEPEAPVSSRVASQRRERPSSSNGDHYSSETPRAPPVGRRARSARTTPSDNVRKTLLPGARSSPGLSGRTSPASCFTAADRPKLHPPDLFTPRSASMLHPASLALRNYLHISASSQHKPQDRPSTCPSFCASGAPLLCKCPLQDPFERFLVLALPCHRT